MAVPQHAIMPLAAVVMLLFAGIAHATLTCPAGYKTCDKSYNLRVNGCECNINTDVNNCGDCGIKCGALCGTNAVPVCKSAKCEFSCTAPFLNCDNNWKNGCEVDGNNDVNNCGNCGTKCKDVPNAVTKCNGGKCEYSCKLGFSNCDGNWMNGCEGACGSDPNNCGACGVKCKDVPNAWTQCANGKCVYSCKSGYANCDNNWMNGCECTPDIDTNHCGGCGKKCPTPKYAGGEAKCTNGKCEVQSCKSGWKWESKKSCCVDGKGEGNGGDGKGGGNGGDGKGEDNGGDGKGGGKSTKGGWR